MISDGEVTHDLGITLKGEGGAGRGGADADVAAGEVDIATRGGPLRSRARADTTIIDREAAA